MAKHQTTVIWRFLLLTAAIILTNPATAPADTWGIVLRNDIVAGTDRHLTNSIGLNWIGDRTDQQEPGSFQEAFGNTLVNLFMLLPFTDLAGRPFSPGISVKQDILTPSNTSESERITDDMPYAGHIASTFSLYGRQDRMIEQYRFMLGLVGPAAAGEEMQKGFHRLIGNDEPRGWDNQLENEMVFCLGYTRGYNTWQEDYLTGLQANWTNTAAIDLGNFANSATVGTIFQIGSSLVENTIMLDSLSTGNTAVQLRTDSENPRLGWTLVFGAYISALGYIYYLDRNPEYDLNHDFLVGHGIMGLNITFNRFIVSFSIHSSQLTLNETLITERWGAISLSLL